MAVTTNIRFKVRGRTAAAWTSSNEVLLDRELGLETDTRKFKFGDGATAWNSLDYASRPGPSGDIVGTTDAQTLSNKTFTGATIFPGSGEIDASGRLGIGMTPTKAIDITVAAGAFSDGIVLTRNSAQRFAALADGSVAWNSGSTGGILTWDTAKAIVRANSGAVLSLQAGGGSGEVTVATNGQLAVPSLRVNVVPTAAAVAQTHHIPININGTTYKLLLAS